MPPLRTVEEARAIVASAISPLAAEQVPVADACGRWLAEDVAAERDSPGFRSSAMDGYAVGSVSVAELGIVGESRAGRPYEGRLGPDEAVLISTGAVVPPGAAAVVPVEQAVREGDAVRVERPAAPDANVREPGEDMRAGEVVLAAGTRLGPAAVASAIGAGRAQLACGRRPAVALLITGDELRDPGSELAPGQIHDSNGPLLAGLVEASGGTVVSRTRVGDDEAATGAAVRAALTHADVLVASGGISVGPHDHIRAALGREGVEERFWRVALRPGKPTWFGTGAGGRPAFGLPGNPVSAAVTFVLFVAPALAALQGGPFTGPGGRARLARAVPRHPQREEAVRVRLELRADGVLATPAGAQGSHVSTSLVGADALALIPAGEGGLAAGAEVTIVMLPG